MEYLIFVPEAYPRLRGDYNGSSNHLRDLAGYVSSHPYDVDQCSFFQSLDPCQDPMLESKIWSEF